MAWPSNWKPGRKRAGRSETRRSDAKAVDWHMGACKVCRFLHRMFTTTRKHLLWKRHWTTRRTQRLSQVQGPSLVTTQLAWWTRAEWSRWLTEVQQQGRLFTKAHLPGLLWQVTLDQGLTTGLAEIVLELHLSYATSFFLSLSSPEVRHTSIWQLSQSPPAPSPLSFMDIPTTNLGAHLI